MKLRILIAMSTALLSSQLHAEIRILENLDCSSTVKDIYTSKTVEKQPEQAFKGHVSLQFEKNKTSVYIGKLKDPNARKIRVKDGAGRDFALPQSTELPSVVVRPFTRRDRRPGLIGYSYEQKSQPMVLGDQTRTRTEETVSISSREITVVKAYKYALKDKTLYSSRHTVRCSLDGEVSVADMFLLSNPPAHQASL